MSPQTRRGRAVPAGHRKTSPRTAAKAVAATPEAVPEEEPELESIEASVTEPRVRRRARRVRRSHMAGSAYGYLKAYIPLFIAFVVLFTGVWAFNSFGPHTPSPAENWQHIQNDWQGKRDDARNRINKADLAATQLSPATIQAYKDLSTATRGWMDALAKVTSWNDQAHTSDQNTTTASDMLSFTQVGKNEADIVDMIVTAGTHDGLLLHAGDLATTDAMFVHDVGLLEYDILGGVSLGTSAPTLAVPSGSLPPSAAPSAGASGAASPSAGESAPASAAPSVSASPSATPVPSPSAS